MGGFPFEARIKLPAALATRQGIRNVDCGLAHRVALVADRR